MTVPNVPRMVSDAALPAYAHVPGRTPRPSETPHAVTVAWADWRSCRPYLLGIDLFNHGYYWEAHESWEAVWLAAGRVGAAADFLKGLIKLAAALVKAREGRVIGVERHARRAVELFRAVADDLPAPAVMMGLSLGELQHEALQIANEPERFLNDRDVPVVRVTDFTMQVADPTPRVPTNRQPDRR